MPDAVYYVSLNTFFTVSGMSVIPGRTAVDSDILDSSGRPAIDAG